MSWPSGAREGRAPWVDDLGRELLGRQVTQARMGAFPIVLDAPRFDLVPRIVERNENVFIQAFVAQPCIEALDVRVLNRLARFDELQLYAMLIGPLVERGGKTTSEPSACIGTTIIDTE